jgi:hypothetical protein
MNPVTTVENSCSMDTSMSSAIEMPLDLNPGSQILFLQYLKAQNINTEILTDFKR